MNKLGTVDTELGTYSYEIIAQSDMAEIEEAFESAQPRGRWRDRFHFNGFTIASHGENNQLPSIARDYINDNPILPEILKKQVRIMYGRGPFLFQEQFNEEGKRERKPIPWEQYPAIRNWLSNWKRKGLPQSVNEYIKKVATDYYHMEEYYSKYHFNRSRRTNGPKPVRGLEALNGRKARKAKRGMMDANEILTDDQCKYILVGDWSAPYSYEMDKYMRLDEAQPLKHPTAVNHVGDFGFDQEIYSTPTYWYGLKEWIKGSNLNSKYINSYLKNSLNAKIHVIIPNAWVKAKEERLQEICRNNEMREQEGKDIITEYEGVEVGSTFDYSMVQKLIEKKLQQASSVMSGEGKNQGKFFPSRSVMTEHGIENWQFEEIPNKYKEFIQSVLEYDQAATKQILAGKGLSPAISNVSNEGVFNSGSNAYYNYMIYLDSLSYAEDYIMYDLNNALDINFPDLKNKNIKLGLYREAPQRQEENPPEERMENNT